MAVALAACCAAPAPAAGGAVRALNTDHDEALLKRGTFSGSARHKAAAVLFPTGGADWRKADLVEMQLRLTGDAPGPRDLGAAVLKGRAWQGLRASKGWTPPLEPGKWRSVYFDLAGAPVDRVDVFRLYFNARNRLTAKPVRFDFRPPRTVKQEIVRELPLRVPAGLPRPRVFPRNQVKYTFFRNYLFEPGYLIDRPLFFDRTLGQDVILSRAGTYANFVAYADLVKRYEIDGFGYHCPRGTYLDRTVTALKYSERLNDPAFTFLAEATPGLMESGPYLDTLFTKITAAKTVWRRNGKAVFSSYCADGVGPARLSRALADLRRKYPGKFLYVAEIRAMFGAAARSFSHYGGVPRHEIEAMKTRLREYLDVTDGIMYAGCNHLATAPRYTKFNAECYRRIVTPMMRSVVDEPKYRGKKLLGLSAASGYVNHLANSTLLEDGTKTLRRSFEIAMAARPDFIVMPEWNEIHENTNIEPTPFNSLANMRILRHYMRKLRGEPVAPMAGDDRAVPNLVLSYRTHLTLGERLVVELLNVPDGARGRVEARVVLRDANGRTVSSSERRTLDLGKLESVDFVWPTESLAGRVVLLPALEVRTPDGKVRLYGEGLPYVRLSATRRFHKKCARRPLRDLLRPKRMDVKWARSCATASPGPRSTRRASSPSSPTRRSCGCGGRAGPSGGNATRPLTSPSSAGDSSRIDGARGGSSSRANARSAATRSGSSRPTWAPPRSRSSWSSSGPGKRAPCSRWARSAGPCRSAKSSSEGASSARSKTPSGGASNVSTRCRTCPCRCGSARRAARSSSREFVRGMC